jgi:hypothetical protein
MILSEPMLATEPATPNSGGVFKLLEQKNIAAELLTIAGIVPDQT